jgi:hypothetical protein
MKHASFEHRVPGDERRAADDERQAPGDELKALAVERRKPGNGIGVPERGKARPDLRKREPWRAKRSPEHEKRHPATEPGEAGREEFEPAQGREIPSEGINAAPPRRRASRSFARKRKGYAHSMVGPPHRNQRDSFPFRAIRAWKTKQERRRASRGKLTTGYNGWPATARNGLSKSRLYAAVNAFWVYAPALQYWCCFFTIYLLLFETTLRHRKYCRENAFREISCAKLGSRGWSYAATLPSITLGASTPRSEHTANTILATPL